MHGLRDRPEGAIVHRDYVKDEFARLAAGLTVTGAVMRRVSRWLAALTREIRGQVIPALHFASGLRRRVGRTTKNALQPAIQQSRIRSR